MGRAVNLAGADVWARARAEADLVLPLPGGDSECDMLFRKVEAGSFLMGTRGGGWSAADPPHEVRIGRDFYLGSFAVTQAQWRAVAGLSAELAERLEPSHFKGARRPVEQVSWEDCVAWGAALAGWDGLVAEVEEVRLPSEAEWEYACRGGRENRQTAYYHGDGEAALAEVGWYAGNAGGKTHAVDEVVSDVPEDHPLGFFGMHGNVWEWCADVWDRNAYRKREDQWQARAWSAQDAGPDEEDWGGENGVRVLRGGSWNYAAFGCRTACRYWIRAGYRYWDYGFRVCLVGSPAPRAEGREPGSEAAAETAGAARRNDEADQDVEQAAER